MLELLEAYSIQQIAVFVVMLALAVKGVSDFFDWVKKKYQEKFDKDYAVKTQETLTQEHYETCQRKFQESVELYNNVDQKLDALNIRLDRIEDSIKRLTESDMNDIKSWIVEKHHKYYPQGWIDDFTMDTLEKRYYDYKQEGGNSYIHSLMEELRSLPHVPPQGKD